jgi:DNA-binding beta-propeller fold protein YncE
MTRLRRLACAAIVLAVGTTCDENAVPELEFGLSEEDSWPDLRVYPGVAKGRLLITNNLSDTVSILDLAKVTSDDLAELARVPVGLIPVEREGPHHVAADPKGEYYYVGISNYVPGSASGPHGTHGSGTADGHALKIRASDNLTVASVRVDRNPGDIRLTPDGQRLLMTHYDLLRIQEVVAKNGDEREMNARLAVLDPTTMTRVAMVELCPAPHGLAVSPDSRTAFASCYSDELAVVDLQRLAVSRVAVLGGPTSATAPTCSPYAVTISPSGDSAWVSCFASGQVLRYDVALGAMDPDRRVKLSGPAVFGTFTKDGKTLLVPHQGADNGIAFVDASTGAVIRDLVLPKDACQNVHTLRISDDEARLFVVCEGTHTGPGTFLVVTRATGAVERSVKVGLYPDDLAILRGPP